MAIKSIHTNKASIQAIKTLLKAGDVLLDMGPIIDRKAPRARAGAAYVPPPSPQGGPFKIIQVYPNAYPPAANAPVAGLSNLAALQALVGTTYATAEEVDAALAATFVVGDVAWSGVGVFGDLKFAAIASEKSLAATLTSLRTALSTDDAGVFAYWEANALAGTTPNAVEDGTNARFSIGVGQVFRLDYSGNTGEPNDTIEDAGVTYYAPGIILSYAAS